MNTNDDGYTYDEWMQAVDKAVLRIAGVSVHDLPDFCSHDEWADGCTPMDSALMLLEEEGFPFDEAEPDAPDWCAPLVPGEGKAPSNYKVGLACSRKRAGWFRLPVLY